MQKTLAQFISETREQEGYSQSGLAKRANLKIEVVENIEAGQELFLATTVRQKIAKALKLDTKDIKVYEKQFKETEPSKETIESIKQEILSGNLENLKCPKCNSNLIARVAEMYDLEDILIKHPKARCSKCPFQLK